jgi:predicted DCC family thiol-disulfide oxidoreductase YuxK
MTMNMLLWENWILLPVFVGALGFALKRDDPLESSQARPAPALDASLPAHIILFDGVCNLCNATVLFVLDRDPDCRFRFASLQSSAGRRLLGRAEVDTDMSSIVLIENGRQYRSSTAALRIARKLSWPWPVLYLLIAVPRPLRDLVYGWVARNRYRWFGRTDTCRVPSPTLMHRFLT